LGTFQDITNEQNLINELQYNVEKFSSIFLVLMMPFLSLINGQISDCNQDRQNLQAIAIQIKACIIQNYFQMNLKETSVIF
jgi:hypothetical protein